MLRPARPAESPALFAIAVSTGLFSTTEAEALLGGVLDALHAGQLGAGHQALVWVPADSDAPAGWVYCAPDPHADGVWNLWWIGVSPAHHGQGGGDALLDAVEVEVRDAQARILIIETSSLPPLARARAFYTRRGYVNCGRIPDFYGVGDDKIIFARPIGAT